MGFRLQAEQRRRDRGTHGRVHREQRREAVPRAACIDVALQDLRKLATEPLYPVASTPEIDPLERRMCPTGGQEHRGSKRVLNLMPQRHNEQLQL